MLMDLIDEKLSEPIKRQGYLDLYNGVDILQTRHYIKLNVKTFVEKVFQQHIATWMKTSYPMPHRSTPLPTSQRRLDQKVQFGHWEPGRQSTSSPPETDATLLSLRRW